MVDFSHSRGRENLESLLEEELSFDATTSNGLTNHLPMALVAKNALGASSEELRRYAARYRQRLVARRDPETVLTRDNWHSAIGREGAFEDLYVYFSRAVKDEGVEATMRDHIDATIPGICGAAFHGAIRLEYAIEVASPQRIAAGLAYLAESAMPLAEPISFDSSGASVDDAFASLEGCDEFAALPSSGLISEQMRGAASMAIFRDALSRTRVSEDTLEQLRATGLTLFATTGDFTSLHAVTGVEALTAIRPFVHDRESFDGACFSGVAAAYATVGAPTLASTDWLDEFSASNDVNIEQIAEAGAQSDDEHVSKLVYSSLRLREATNNDLYLAVAARKAGLSC
jgi:hypothetical protein